MPPVDERRADAPEPKTAREERRRGLLLRCRTASVGGAAAARGDVEKLRHREDDVGVRGAREYNDAAVGSVNANAMARMCMGESDVRTGQAKKNREREERERETISVYRQKLSIANPKTV